MRPTILTSTIVFLLLIGNFFSALAQEPPFYSVTISGHAPGKYDRVSLFENGSSSDPLKTEYFFGDNNYSLTVYRPEDLLESGNRYSIDLRFWRDTNDNGIMDDGIHSQCHFIVWIPAAEKVIFKVYDGPQYEITSSEFEYNYE